MRRGAAAPENRGERAAGPRTARNKSGHVIRRIALTISALAAIVLGNASAAGPRVPDNDPLFIRLIANPSPARAAVFHGDDRYRSAFEVYLTNFGATPMKLRKVTIKSRRNGGTVGEAEVSGKELAGSFQLAGFKPSPYERPELEAGRSGVIFLFPEVENRAVDEIDTSINLEGWGAYAGSGSVSVAAVLVRSESPIVIEAPVRGANWLAANGPSNKSAHRRAVLFVGGKPKIGQRYAIDWVQVGPDGRTFRGDEHDNRSYYAYDHPIYAAADGTIVSVKDGIAENVPNSEQLAAPIGLETIAGNNIIEDLGGGRFAAYAHLRPGTIKVKPGERVHSGQMLARLGNTGNSSEPHLHFQVCDAPAFVDSQGLPFAIRRFTRNRYRIDKPQDGKQSLVISAAQKVANQ